MMISRVARQWLCAAAIVATLGGFAGAGRAFAQVFGYPPYGGPSPYGYRDDYGPPPGYGPDDDDRGPRYGGPPGRRAGAPFASRRAIAGLLAERGLRLEGPLDFEGPNIVAMGVDPAGRARRFVIDPYEGAVLSARPLPQMAARPDRFGEEGFREDMPPPPPAAVRPRSPAQLSEDPPVWRAGPPPAGAPGPGAKTHSASVERHDAAPPEKRKPVPAQAQEASAAPARPAAAPMAQAAPSAAPTGELEPPRPGG
jgi:hypothetical protein